MKTLSILILLGLISGCNEKETEIIELEPPTMAVQEETQETVNEFLSYRELANKPCTIACEEEVVEEAEIIEETEEVEGGAI